MLFWASLVHIVQRKLSQSDRSGHEVKLIKKNAPEWVQCCSKNNML